METPESQSAASKPVTTFVQTDSNTFREVVQRLTGPSETGTVHGAAAVKAAGTKRQTSKLHERRHCTRPKLEIVKPHFPFKPGNQCFSPSKSGNSSLQPSPVGTPSTMLSKLVSSNISQDKREIVNLTMQLLFFPSAHHVTGR